MKYSIDILEALFQLINTTTVKDAISGEIYQGSRPKGNQLENITINILNNPIRYFQEGYANLNIYIPEVKAGVPNLARFKEVLALVIPLVEDVKTNTYTFQIDDDKGVFQDKETDNMYFYNLKLKFQTI